MQSSFLSLLILSICFSSTLINLTFASNSLSIKHNPLDSILGPDGKLTKTAKSKVQSRFKSSSHSSKRALIDEPQRSTSLRSRDQQQQRAEFVNESKRQQQSQNERGLISDLVGGVVGAAHSALHDSLSWRDDNGWGIAVAETENDEIDNEWLVNVGIGRPSQRLEVVLDTGSPLAWVYSPACCYASNHTFFNPRKSISYHNRTINSKGEAVPAKSSKTPGQPWNITYGGGSSSGGYLGYDRMVFGEGSDEIKLPSTSVGLTTEITGNSRAGRGMEGIIGMSPGATAGVEGGWVTPFEGMVEDGLLDQNYFSATFIKADRRTGKDGGGRYVFGSLDHEVIDGDVIWVNSTSTVYWGGLYDGMKMVRESDGKSYDVSSEVTLKRCILDTGSALLNVPASIAAAANARIHGSLLPSEEVGWLVPCKTGLPEYEASLKPSQRTPDFYFQIGGSQFKIPTEDFVFYPLEPVSLEESNGKKDMCPSAFQIGPEAFAVIGASLFKNTAITFDLGNPATATSRRLGFANRTMESLTI